MSNYQLRARQAPARARRQGLPGPLKGAEERRRRIIQWLGDGAYDSDVVFEALEARGIEPVIKPRRNSVLGTGSSAKGRAVREFQELGYEGWAEEKGYGRRWAVETAFSTFKRLFGEHSLARSIDCITRELVAKASLYNLLVNM